MIAHKDAKDRYDVLAKAAAKAEVSSGKKRGGEEEEEGGGGGAARYVFSSLRSPPLETSQPPHLNHPNLLCSSAKKSAVGGGSKPITRLTVELNKFSEKQRNKLLELGIIKPDGENWTTTGTVPVTVRRLNHLGSADKSIPHLNNVFDFEDYNKIITLGLVRSPVAAVPVAPVPVATEGDEVRFYLPPTLTPNRYVNCYLIPSHSHAITGESHWCWLEPKIPGAPGTLSELTPRHPLNPCVGPGRPVANIYKLGVIFKYLPK